MPTKNTLFKFSSWGHLPGRKGAPIIRCNGHQAHPRKGEKLRESGTEITPTPGRPAHIFGIWSDYWFRISSRLLPQN